MEYEIFMQYTRISDSWINNRISFNRYIINKLIKILIIAQKLIQIIYLIKYYIILFYIIILSK